MKVDKTTVITGIMVLIFGFVIWQYIIPYFVTTSRVEKSVRIAQSKDLIDGYCFENKVDWWNNPICTKRELVEEGRAVAYMAISAGRDGVFDTKDDYTAIEID